MEPRKINALMRVIENASTEVQENIEALEFSTEIEAENKCKLKDGSSYKVTVKIEELTDNDTNTSI